MGKPGSGPGTRCLLVWASTSSLHVFAKKAGVGSQPLPYTQLQGPFLLLHCHARLLGLQPQDLRGGLCVPEGSLSAGALGRLGTGSGGPSPACSECVQPRLCRGVRGGSYQLIPTLFLQRGLCVSLTWELGARPQAPPQTPRVGEPAVQALPGIRGCCSRPTSAPRRAWGPSHDQRSPSGTTVTALLWHIHGFTPGLRSPPSLEQSSHACISLPQGAPSVALSGPETSRAVSRSAERGS